MKKQYALAITALVCVATLLAAAGTRNTQTATEHPVISNKTTISVPEPVTLLLLGSGLVALTAGRRFAKRKPQVSLPTDKR